MSIANLVELMVPALVPGLEVHRPKTHEVDLDKPLQFALALPT